MQRHLMKSKIHRATITAADLHYEGSLTVDQDLLDAADLAEFEDVQIVNINNGQRFNTYVIPGPRGSGAIQLNGAAARLGLPGDLVIIIAYGVFDEAEVERFEPRVVFVDGQNRVVRPSLRAEH
ncbi:MAG TPA: aspartate 1-decarboxylase [Gemmatimonadales bacterium]|nr:aspartate 1-decarboxylase [Gemmatimonadales bacterium]